MLEDPLKKHPILLVFSCLAAIFFVVDKFLRISKVFSSWDGSTEESPVEPFRRIVVGLLEVGKEAVFFGANLYNHYVERVVSDRMCSESNFNFFLTPVLRSMFLPCLWMKF